jgi:hypothetical protein
MFCGRGRLGCPLSAGAPEFHSQGFVSQAIVLCRTEVLSRFDRRYILSP